MDYNFDILKLVVSYIILILFIIVVIGFFILAILFFWRAFLGFIGFLGFLMIVSWALFNIAGHFIHGPYKERPAAVKKNITIQMNKYAFLLSILFYFIVLFILDILFKRYMH